MTLSTRPLRRLRPTSEMLETRALLNAGGLDTSYGGTGEVVTSESSSFTVTGMVVEPNLETVVVGLEASSTTPYDNTVIVRYNVNGTLDTSFGSGGTVVLATNTDPSIDIHPNHNVSVAVQPNGQLLVATDTTTYTYTAATKKTAATYTITGVSIMVARLNANGSLDTTFGNGGEAVISIPKAFEAMAGVAVLSSGEIIVAGSNISSTYTGPEFVVARLTSSGALDTTFGPSGQGYNGLAYTAPPAGYLQSDGVGSLAIDASGNILVGGYVVKSGTTITSPYQVVRYTPSGLLDTSFANGGIFDLSKTYVQYGVSSIGFQSDGQIILGLPLWEPSTAAVLRLNTNGTIDTTFATNGFYLVSSSLYAYVAVQPGDDIVFDTEDLNTEGIEVGRLLPGGTLDSSFGTGGVVNVAFPEDAVPVALVIGPDGKITGANSVYIDPDYAIGTFRLLNDITSNVASTASVSSSSTAAVLMGALTPELVDSALKNDED
jgi:uncharacterized delta-60 repeat protein